MGTIIFNDKSEKKKLERVTHRAIFREMYNDLMRFHEAGENIIILDAPLLLETRILEWFCYPIVCVYNSNKEV